MKIDVGSTGCAFDMGGATVELHLTGNNSLKSGLLLAGLQANENATLTIFSEDEDNGGTLTVTGGAAGGAGIGGRSSVGFSPGADESIFSAGTINIVSGTIYANGGTYGAGIGGGLAGTGGTINIYGGDIHAQGGEQAAGIGGGGPSGAGGSSPSQTSGGTITIYGGSVDATGGGSTSTTEDAGAGIGGGNWGYSGTIRVRKGLWGNSVTAATGGADAQDIGHGANIEDSDNQGLVDLEADFMTDGSDEGFVPNHKFPASGYLTITQGDGKSVNVVLNDADTMDDAVKKINDAISSGLGQAAYVDDPTKFCTVADGTENTSEAVCDRVPFYDEDGKLAGYRVFSTLLIRSAVAGKAGELSFTGSQNLLEALNLITIQESRENVFTANVSDAHTGTVVASGVKVTGNQLIGVVHRNVDVTFDNMAAVTASWNDAMKRYDLLKDGTYTTYLHLADNSVAFQTGANEGDQMFIDIGDMSAAALGITTVSLYSPKSAARAITLIDNAIDRVSSQRSKIGAYQNRLEYGIMNLSVAGENLTAAESRIRDTDMASTMTQFVKLQIMAQAGMSMLAQANQLPQAVLSLIGR